MPASHDGRHLLEAVHVWLYRPVHIPVYADTLLPARPARHHRHPGRLPISDRTALAGIVHVLRKGVAWRDVPVQVVGCSGVTAWRRLVEWTEAGVWHRLHEILVAELRAPGLLEMDDSAIGGSHVRALKEGPTPDLPGRPGKAGQQEPADRRPPRNPARRHDDRRQSTRRHTVLPLPDATPPIRGLRGCPRTRPRRLFADCSPTVRRPRLRLRQVPPPTVEARCQAGHRTSRRRPRLKPGQDPLGGRADLRLAPPVQAPAYPLRDTR